jgi:MerR family transcriptional regulator, copper efflux regulator
MRKHLKFGVLRIGVISKKTRVPVVTIRYYETQGLIPRSNAAKTLHRRYPMSVVEDILFIKECRMAGFSLPEIKSMLRIFRGLPPERIMKSVYRTIASVDARISSLNEIKRILKLRLRDPSRKDDPAPSVLD